MPDTDSPDQTADQTPDAALRRALLAIKDLRARAERAERAANEPIAIIGMGCRFPGGANSPDRFWDLLDSGVDAVAAAPAGRWEHVAYRDTPGSEGSVVVEHGGFLDVPVDRFDAGFFNIAPVEAADVDPQQRLLLEVTWEALEDAGVAPDRLAGSSTGVFIGLSTSDYAHLALRSVDLDDVGTYAGTGVAPSVAAGRISFVLGLRGPAVCLDTACSSSLVAIAQATQSLRSGACRMALAGGVNLMLDPETFESLTRLNVLSPTGRCHTFAADADGYVRGEGAGMLVLKRLSDAQADGDRVLALIRAAAVNHDGRSGGLTVPSGPAQRELIERAIAEAGIEPADVDLVEAHGTGTPLGDPIELRALDAVYSRRRSASHPLLIGSVKTNIGHLEAAAGIAGVIKVVLALRHGRIPAHLHCDELSPHVDWGSIGIEVVRNARPWPEGDRVRRAGVSGFGWSGTNAHVILEQPPAAIEMPVPPESVLLPLSARDPVALAELTVATADAIEGGLELSDLAWTLQSGRARFRSRAAVTAARPDDAVARLRAVASGAAAPGTSSGSLTSAGTPRLAFVYTGQGAQLPGMGRGLYESEPVFRDVVDACAAAVAPHLPIPLLDVLYGDPDQARAIHDTRYTQPAMFALQCGLTALWRSWGIEPDMVAGHSIGEYAAAVTAGVMTLDDASALIAVRAMSMGALAPGGRMVAVFADEATVEPLVQPVRASVSIAAVNGPANVVVSGDGAAVTAIVASLDAAGIRHRSLEVSHAFHSPLMAPVIDDLARASRTIRLDAPSIGFVSTVTGKVEDEAVAEPGYWCDQVVAPVRFADAVRSIRAAGVEHLVEIGPNATLVGMIAQITGSRAGLHASLRAAGDARRDPELMLDALGELWVAGIEPDWSRVGTGPRRPIGAPTYPFQRQRHWLQRTRRRAGNPGAHPLLGSTVTVPSLGATVHEVTVDAQSPRWLGHHRVGDSVVIPGAAFAEAVLAAAGAGASIERLDIREAIVVPVEGITLQTVVTEQGDVRRVEITTIERDESATVRARPRVEATSRPPGDAAGAAIPARLDVGSALDEFHTEVEVESLYAELAALGLDYGPAFRSVVRVRRRDGAALGRVELDGGPNEARRYRLHPALLDACFQMVWAALGELDDRDDVFLPASLSGVTVHRDGVASGWCTVSVIGAPTSRSSSIETEIHVYDDDGEPVATVERFVAERTSRSVFRRSTGGMSTSGLTYGVSWRATALSDAAEAAIASWLVIGRGDLADGLVDELRQRPEVEVASVDPSDPVATAAALDRNVSGRGPDRRGVVVVLEGADVSGEHAVDAVLERVLAVGQLLARHPGPARLYIVTRAAQSIDGEPPDVPGGAVWGLARTIASEHPELACTCIDLDGAPQDGDVRDLAGELLASSRDVDGETQIAYRAGRRFVARLARLGAEAFAGLERPYELELAGRGSLDLISYRPGTRRTPGRGEVEIEVRATALNFRDVLNVLGMYPGDPGPPGVECAGVVTAVGDGVGSVSVGDAVVGIAPRAFDSHVVTLADLVVPKPAALSFAEAASLPVASLTAFHGLVELAGLGEGESVLVHAGAGGVGMAAVALAQRRGATVFATVGSLAKRRTLEALGVRHIYSSRSLDFADGVLADTGGRGVDVVLNSLSDEFIGQSLRILAPEGRFVEIGKRGVWSSEQVAAVRSDVSYHVYELGDFLAADPGGVRSALRSIVDEAAAGVCAPPPIRAFDARRIGDAFRFVAQARHTGKVVVTHPAPSPVVRADASYLVTGGLGGIGLAVAGWLVKLGARFVVLAGRSDPGPDAVEAIARLRSTGATIDVVRADVSDPAAVARLVSDAGARAPLRGVFHIAGSIDDAPLEHQSPERIGAVLSPKLAGAEAIAAATRSIDLDHFVLFSSIASMLGSPGQANYAAANAALDTVAQRRRASGRPALSVSWGAWADVGMAARLGEHERRRMIERGMRPLPTAVAIDALESVIGSHIAHVGVMDVDWSALARHAGRQAALIDDLVAASGDVAGGDDRTERLTEILLVAAPEEWLALATAHVVGHLARVLGLPSTDSIDPEQDLTELGMDSLMAVELSNRLSSSTRVEIATTVALECPTARAIGLHVLDRIAPAIAIEREVASMSDDAVASAAAASPAPEASPDASSKRAELLRRRLVEAGVQSVEPIEPSDPTATPVLSYAQERMWLLDRMHDEHTALVIRMAARLRGPLDRHAFRRSLDAVYHRHDVLRTVYEPGAGDPQPVVLPRGSMPLEEIDVCGDLAAVDRILEAEASRTFDLTREPPVRTTLLRVDDEHHVVAVAMHHIASDGASVAIFLAELRDQYAAAVAGQAMTVEPLRIQYGDFAAWQRSHSSARLARELEYWREKLADLPRFEIPADHRRPSRRTFDGDSVTMPLTPGLRDRLEAVGHERGATLFNVLLSVFDVVAARHAGATDVVVGTPVTGRVRAELAPMIGPFINTVVLRTDLGDAPRFTDLVERVRVAVIEASEHQHVPFEQVIQAVNPARDPSRTPLFQIMFNMLPFDAGAEFGLTGVESEVLDLQDVASNFDMTMYVTDLGATTTLRLVYNRRLFDRGHMEAFARQFVSVAEQVADEPWTTVDRLSLALPVTDALPDPSETLDASWRGSVPDAVRAVADRSPDRIAVIEGDRTVSYGDLLARAVQVASHLKAGGVGRGDVVAIAGHRSAPLTWAILGALSSGAMYTVLDPHHPPARIATMLRIARPTAWLAVDGSGAAPPEVAEVLDELGVGTRSEIGWEAPDPDVSAVASLRGLVDEIIDTIGPDDPACLTFTSGSTGTPKAVVGRHGSLTHFLPWMTDEFDVSGDDRFSMLSGLGHDPLQRDLFWPWWLGAAVVIPDPASIGESAYLASWMRRHGVSVAHLTPAMGQILVEARHVDPDLTVPSLRRTFFIGDALTRSLAARVRRVAPGAKVVNLYGTTETQRASGFHVPDLDASEHGLAVRRDVLPLGTGMPGSQLLVVTRAASAAGVGEIGEVAMRSHHLALRYHDDPELTAARFRGDPTGGQIYLTGDVGRYRHDGVVEHLGRSDSQVQVRGFRVETAEIEAALRAHPGVREVVVVARGEASDATLVAYPVFEPALVQPPTSELRVHLRRHLPDYMVPARFVPLEALPLTANRKIDHAALPDHHEVDGLVRREPSTPTERALAAVWVELLELDDVGVDDNFFDLGGHSVLATRIVSRIPAICGKDLPLRAVFEAPTIAELASVIDATDAEAHTVDPIPILDRDRPLPVSFAQERMWFLDKLVTDPAVYKIANGARLRGPLDVESMSIAVDRLVARHESLRSRVLADDEGALTVAVDPPPSGVLARFDLTGENDPYGRAMAEIEGMVHGAVDFERGDAFRPALFRLGVDDHILFAVVHHMFADGWSSAVIAEDLAELYQAHVEGRAPALADLGPQFVDFAAWQRAKVMGPDLRRQLEYWRSHLDGMTPAQLPTDHPRPRLDDHAGITLDWPIDRALLAAVTAAARNERVSVFEYLLASFQALLLRYGDHPDVAVGVPLAYRRRLDVERIVGDFVNLLVIRAQPDPDASFRDLVHEVADALHGAHANPDMPFDALVAELSRSHDLSRAPLVQVMFNVHQPPRRGRPMTGLDVDPLVVDRGAAQFDLSVVVITTETLIDPMIRVEYKSALFDHDTVERLVAQWQELLRDALDRPTAPWRELSMMPEWQMSDIDRWSTSPVDALAGVPVDAQRVDLLVEATCRRTPDATAVRAGADAITYGELLDRTDLLARRLAAVGVRRGDRVGVALRRSHSMVEVLLALWKVGAAYVPLDPAFPSDRLSFMIADAHVGVVLTNGPDVLADDVVLGDARLLDVTLESSGAPAAGESLPSAAGLDGTDVAYVIYTSGSTGRPKGVEIEQRAAYNFLVAMRDEPGMSSTDVLLAVTTLSFDISVLELFLPLVVGGQVVVAGRDESMDGGRLARLIESSGATVMQATPTTWSMLFDLGWQGDSALRVLCGGEAMPPQLARRLVESCGEVWNMFGPTETTVWSTVHLVTKETLERGSIPIGHPIATTVCRVLDRSGAPVPVGVPGELLIGGAGLARGYLGRAELTAERFVPDPLRPGAMLYRTGDLARWRVDGVLECLGRLDHQVKVRGFRIELGEIESALAEHPGVAEAVVTADGSGAEARLLGYLVPVDPGATPQHAELRAWLLQRLPDYMVPSRFIELERMPLTPNRKIDRNALPRPSGVERAVDRVYVEPRNDLEAVVCDVFAATLKLDRVGVDDNFFELGGHSLHATSVLAKLHSIFGVEADLREFFLDPTAAQIAEVLVRDPATKDRVEQVATIQRRLNALSPDEIRDMLAARRPVSQDGPDVS